MEQQISLFGEEIAVPQTDTSKILDKLSKPKKVSKKKKEITVQDRLTEINSLVNEELGIYKDQVMLITNKHQLDDYFDQASKRTGIISIDTETNKSLDPLTCKLMGLCIYTKGLKAAYVPVSHINVDTGELLPNQVTTEEIGKSSQALIDKDVKIVMHHGKFDYGVIKYTCGIELPIWWDTMIASQLLNENEPAGLKYQYAKRVDPSDKDYHIDTYFDNIDYEVVDPNVFMLYAAVDALKTGRLQEVQQREFEAPGMERLYKLFMEIEMPVVLVTAKMELRGLAIDEEFAKRLSDKFHKRLDIVDRKIEVEMSKYKDKIDKWRLTPEANEKKPTIDKSTGKQKLDKKGNPAFSKSLSEQLAEPIELTSPTQLGILLYDILKILKKNKDGKKVTDEATLLEIKDKLPLIELILKKREYEKYLGTYIDKLPECRNPRDNRIHPKYNQMGREDKNVVTGRMSSSDPNLQNIPARGDIVTVRCIFVPTVEYNEVDSISNTYNIPKCDEVLLSNGNYIWPEKLNPGDVLDTGEVVKNIEIQNRQVLVYV